MKFLIVSNELERLFLVGIFSKHFENYFWKIFAKVLGLKTQKIFDKFLDVERPESPKDRQNRKAENFLLMHCLTLFPSHHISQVPFATI